MASAPRETVLLVDDSRTVLEELAGALEGRCDVLASLDGNEGLRLAQELRPDLVLLDLVMGPPDGYEVCAALRGDERTKDIPVIFVTALDAPLDEARGLEAGAADYLAKPIRPEVVRARVASHLARRRAERERERLITELRAALEHVRTLEGLLPICAWCKKIRDDKGYWTGVEKYLVQRTSAQFTHGICPDCAARVEASGDLGDG
jgi:PleD family two-component response regulator